MINNNLAIFIINNEHFYKNLTAEEKKIIDLADKLNIEVPVYCSKETIKNVAVAMVYIGDIGTNFKLIGVGTALHHKKIVEVTELHILPIEFSDRFTYKHNTYTKVNEKYELTVSWV